jgi:hypothetical protein
MDSKDKLVDEAREALKNAVVAGKRSFNVSSKTFSDVAEVRYVMRRSGLTVWIDHDVKADLYIANVFW